MWGRETLTTVVSSTSMKVLDMTAMAISQGLMAWWLELSDMRIGIVRNLARTRWRQRASAQPDFSYWMPVQQLTLRKAGTAVSPTAYLGTAGSDPAGITQRGCKSAPVHFAARTAGSRQLHYRPAIINPAGPGNVTLRISLNPASPSQSEYSCSV